MERLTKHDVVTYFVGGKPSPNALMLWIRSLQVAIGNWVGLGRDLGQGFFLVLSKQQTTIQKLMMITSHRFYWGTCILQTWTAGFNANKSSGLRIPTWVTLKNVPNEYLKVAPKTASRLGLVLGVDKRNEHMRDQRYCIGLLSGLGWRGASILG